MSFIQRWWDIKLMKTVWMNNKNPFVIMINNTNIQRLSHKINIYRRFVNLKGFNMHIYNVYTVWCSSGKYIANKGKR